MPWGNRKHPSDSGYKPTWGWRDCPRCGKKVTMNARGFKSHLRACLSKELVLPNGIVVPPADPEYMKIHYPKPKRRKLGD